MGLSSLLLHTSQTAILCREQTKPLASSQWKHTACNKDGPRDAIFVYTVGSSLQMRVDMARRGLRLRVVLLSVPCIFMLACSSAPESIQTLREPKQTPAATEQNSTLPIETRPEEPTLSNTLLRDCDPTQTSGGGDFDDGGLQIGEKAVNFTLRDIHGTEYRLSQLLAEKPVMMVFGSCT